MRYERAKTIFAFYQSIFYFFLARNIAGNAQKVGNLAIFVANRRYGKSDRKTTSVFSDICPFALINFFHARFCDKCFESRFDFVT